MFLCVEQDITRQSSVSSMGRSKKKALLASLDELGERMPSLLDIDHPCAQRQIANARCLVEVWDCLFSIFSAAEFLLHVLPTWSLNELSKLVCNYVSVAFLYIYVDGQGQVWRCLCHSLLSLKRLNPMFSKSLKCSIPSQILLNKTCGL